MEEKVLVFTAYAKELAYKAYNISKYVLDKGGIPINPFMNFGYNLGDDARYVNKVREANNKLVEKCDEVWVFGDYEKADGVIREIGIANKSKIKVRYLEQGVITWREKF